MLCFFGVSGSLRSTRLEHERTSNTNTSITNNHPQHRLDTQQPRARWPCPVLPCPILSSLSRSPCDAPCCPFVPGTCPPPVPSTASPSLRSETFQQAGKAFQGVSGGIDVLTAVGFVSMCQHVSAFVAARFRVCFWLVPDAKL